MLKILHNEILKYISLCIFKQVGVWYCRVQDQKKMFVLKKETHNFLNIDEERQESNEMKYSWEKYTSNFFLNLILACLHSWIQNEHSVKFTNGYHFNFFISRLNNLLW